MTASQKSSNASPRYFCVSSFNPQKKILFVVADGIGKQWYHPSLYLRKPGFLSYIGGYSNLEQNIAAFLTDVSPTCRFYL